MLCMITLTKAVSTLSCMRNKSIKKPQYHIECYKVKLTPFMFYECHKVIKFIPFRSMANHFRVTGYFETSAPNESK